MIYTKRYIYSLSLIVSIIIFFLTNFLIFKIQTNYIKFEESQVISSENPIIDESKKEISNKDSSSSTKIKSSESANKTKTETKADNKEQIKTIKSDWRVEIPIINLDAPIAEGVGDAVIAETVGHFEESSKWNGNVALAAHNRGYECNFFQEIKKLKKDDIIIYHTSKRNKKV